MNNSLVTYRIFDPYPELLAFTSTKQTITFAETPRFTGHKETVNVRRRLAAILGVPEGHLIFPQQTHTSRVAKIDRTGIVDPEHTDALITNLPGICLCVQTADCVPILLYDPEKRAIAAVHAGWRGTVSGIARETVNKMICSYGSSPADLLAVMGPSIGPDVYEVGPAVVEAVRKNIPGAEGTIQQKRSGSFHFDLWEANRMVLLASGLNPEKVKWLGECTWSLSGKYYSARREGTGTGRMVSGIMLME